MAKKKLFIVDIETSGLYPKSGHVILSIGAVAENVGAKAKKEPFTEFYGVVRPTPETWAKATPGALKVNGITWDYLQECGKPFGDVRDDFLRWLMEYKISQRTHIWLGQNPKFDLGFMDHYMGSELRFINAPLWQDALDIQDLYGILANRRKVPMLPHTDGHSISKALGVPEEPKPHNALEGARVVKRNFDALVALGLYE